ncbi:hypothetical protein [Streptomyces sp. NPDC056165]|uniref:hypothetical protein n=1 Tax=Streptomyces sp. NPDC056165 TaxID=3345733 RepID=UPI0035E1CEED
MLSLMFVSLPGQFAGPFASFVGGTDISIAVALGSSFLLAAIVARFFPEPSYVVDGSRPGIEEFVNKKLIRTMSH